MSDYLTPLGDCPCAFLADPGAAPDPYRLGDMENEPAPRVHGQVFRPYAGGRGSAAQLYPKDQGGPDLTLSNLLVGQSVGPRGGDSDLGRRGIDLFPTHVLPRFLNDVDVWNPYIPPVRAFDNPDISGAQALNVEATFKPALEPPRYDLTAQDTEDIIETAKRRLMLKLGILKP